MDILTANVDIENIDRNMFMHKILVTCSAA